MSPYRRPGSPFWQIRPTVTLPGRGRVRLTPRSTGTKDKARATAMETMLAELPMKGYADLVERMERGEVRLDELYAANLSNRLDEIRDRANNPLLSESIARFRETVRDSRVLAGTDNLLRLAMKCSKLPEGQIRLSYLRDPRNVLSVLQAMEKEGHRRNTVRRSLYRAISDLLTTQIGKGTRAEILSEVRFTVEDDERQVHLSGPQIASLLGAIIEDRFRCAVELALTTGIDRKPLLALEGRHFHEERNELAIPDKKTGGRLRTIEVSPRAAGAIRTAMQIGRVGPGDRIFPWTVGQFRDRWDAARESAGLDWLRFKDLRAVFATAYLQAGGSAKQLQEILGHLDMKMTLRYVKRLPVRQGAEMRATAEYLGMGRSLRIAVNNPDNND